jgi:hypothetical protein
VQLILSPEDDRDDREAFDNFDCDSYSRYAEPEADGVTPVLRTTRHKRFVCMGSLPRVITYTSFAGHLALWFVPAY